MPTVSICIPTYNGEEYLRACLDSVLAQSFRDFEVLIVDDCSRDSTIEIVNEYAQHHANIRVFRNATNLGLVGNWNRCIELAEGKWIKFVFQDDLIAPDCLSMLVGATQDGHDLVFCARDFIFEDGTSDLLVGQYLGHQALLRELYAPSNAVSGKTFSKFALQHLGVNLVGEPTVVLIRKSAFATYGSFSPFLIHDGDLEYWNRIGTRVGVRYVDQVLATFRVHAKSTTATNTNVKTLRKKLDQVLVLHEMAFSPVYNAFRAASPDPASQRMLQKAFWNAAYVILLVNEFASHVNSQPGGAADEFRRILQAHPQLANLPLRYRVIRWLDVHSPKLLHMLQTVRTRTRAGAA